MDPTDRTLNAKSTIFKPFKLQIVVVLLEWQVKCIAHMEYYPTTVKLCHEYLSDCDCAVSYATMNHKITSEHFLTILLI